MEVRFPHLLRTPRHRWWKPIAGMALAAVTWLAAATGLLVAVMIALAVTDSDLDPLSDEALDPSTPLGLLGTNLAIAMIVPPVLLAVFVVHRQRPGFLSSVVGRLRWTLLGRLLLVGFGLSVLSYGFVSLVPFGDDHSGATASSRATLAALLLVILLTTPLQAAAEEYGFRGYLLQAVASWFNHPKTAAVIAGVVSAALFALAHGVQDAWLFGDRLAFGLVAAWLAWRTGGLEAPIALHVANNMVALTVAVFTGTLGAALTATSVDPRLALIDVAMMLAFAVTADRLAVRRQVAVVSDDRAVGYPGKRLEPSAVAGSDSQWGMG